MELKEFPERIIGKFKSIIDLSLQVSFIHSDAMRVKLKHIHMLIDAYYWYQLTVLMIRVEYIVWTFVFLL